MLYFNKSRECIKERFFLLAVVPLCFMLSACELPAKKAVKNNSSGMSSVSAPAPAQQVATAPSTGSQNSEGEASLCQRELIALSKLNQNAYAQKKAAFDELLSSASVYTAVRNDIGAQTKATMDALYKYKTQKLCSDIEQSVRLSLINSGETIK